MKRIRINNDFTFAWAIERNGQPEDLSTAITVGYYDVPRFGYTELPQTTVNWNTGLSVKSIKVRYSIPGTLIDTYQTYNTTL